jgi:hypothetical protein
MRALLCTALLALTATAAASTAQAGSLLDLAVVDRDTGETLRTYRDDGKLYVAGTPGHRYSVRLSNRTGGRVLAVLSVDGVNAVTGETASPEQSGYVLDPWESTEIAGWRKSNDEIAQFNFTTLPDSYAARTGRPQNVGVIGVAVFTERVPFWRHRDEIAKAESRREQSEANADSMGRAGGSAPATSPLPAPAEPKAAERSLAQGAPQDKRPYAPDAEKRLGTGHGAREYSHVDTTTFNRATRRPAEQIAVYYDSYRNLVARGIIERPIARRDPEPFPNGYVPDPPAR